MTRVPKLNLKRVVQSRGETSDYLQSPGDAVLIERGRPRWLLMLCPCGCGEELPINLDSRAGPAWRLYRHPRQGVSVYPSVWRDTGCESHFIIWRNSIILFGQGDDDFWLRGRADEIAAISGPVRERLPVTGFVSYVDIADSLGEVPWDVLNACRQLVRNGIAREGAGKQRGTFGQV
jgi:hypothetical protein